MQRIYYENPATTDVWDAVILPELSDTHAVLHNMQVVSLFDGVVKTRREPCNDSSYVYLLPDMPIRDVDGNYGVVQCASANRILTRPCDESAWAQPSPDDIMYRMCTDDLTVDDLPYLISVHGVKLVGKNPVFLVPSDSPEDAGVWPCVTRPPPTVLVPDDSDDDVSFYDSDDDCRNMPPITFQLTDKMRDVARRLGDDEEENLRILRDSRTDNNSTGYAYVIQDHRSLRLSYYAYLDARTGSKKGTGQTFNAGFHSTARSAAADVAFLLRACLHRETSASSKKRLREDAKDAHVPDKSTQARKDREESVIYPPTLPQSDCVLTPGMRAIAQKLGDDDEENLRILRCSCRVTGYHYIVQDMRKKSLYYAQLDMRKGLKKKPRYKHLGSGKMVNLRFRNDVRSAALDLAFVLRAMLERETRATEECTPEVVRVDEPATDYEVTAAPWGVSFCDDANVLRSQTFLSAEKFEKTATDKEIVAKLRNCESIHYKWLGCTAKHALFRHKDGIVAQTPLTLDSLSSNTFVARHSKQVRDTLVKFRDSIFGSAASYFQDLEAVRSLVVPGQTAGTYVPRFKLRKYQDEAPHATWQQAAAEVLDMIKTLDN